MNHALTMRFNAKTQHAHIHGPCMEFSWFVNTGKYELFLPPQLLSSPGIRGAYPSKQPWHFTLPFKEMHCVPESNKHASDPPPSQDHSKIRKTMMTHTRPVTRC